MRRPLLAIFAATSMAVIAASQQPAFASTAPVPRTATGIPLDAQWKISIYHLATTKFKHPAWGWQHSERNYQVALRLAKGDHLNVDTDVLFAACFLHDMAAFPPYQKKGEHGVVAAEESVAVLRDAGFPMSKIAAVQAAERGHMYYSDAGSRPESIVLHDADSLDFLGTIGEARMISLTGANAASFRAGVTALRSFLHDIPPRLITKTAKSIGAQRVVELERELDELQSETFNGSAM
ncbi:MAG TPA: HD domain-containing protein [Candidatus Eremiobacteraceae bacterium]|nr:HD domain-containing protein [Candidatus Eremiobacteraceae bacterium]